jgi:hypothetical protein
MITILFIEDTRRPGRNEEFKEQIRMLQLDANIEYCTNINPDYLLKKKVDGIAYHSGMEGYRVVNAIAKKLGWLRLSYSGAVNSVPYLSENKIDKKQFSVDSDYFVHVLPEFVERCKAIGQHN